MATNKTQRILKQLTNNTARIGSEEMILPNNSGDHKRSVKRDAPIISTDLVNKEYADRVITETRSIILTIDDFRKGSTGPSDTTVGSTPTIPVLLFNATNELLSIHTIMPINWDKSKDCTLDLVFGLTQAETNGDVISITVDYTTVKTRTTGAGIAKTSTQITPTTTVTTANGLADGDLYVVAGTLSQTDTENGFAAGDRSGGFCLEFHLTNTTGVGAVHFISGCINYSATIQ